MYTFECFFIIDEAYVQDGIPFKGLLQNVPENKICSTVLLSLRKPACSFLSFSSTPSAIFLISTLPITFATTGINVIPLQFPHLVRSPFFASLTIRFLLQSAGTVSLYHIVRQRCETAKEVLGYRTKSGKSWISSDS